jgi:hypothetical protein
MTPAALALHVIPALHQTANFKSTKEIAEEENTRKYRHYTFEHASAEI